MYLENIIINLKKFWKEKGFLILESLDMEMGATTFHHDTFFRSIKKDPFQIVILQSCRRPLDGRYGKNNCRLQKYYQLQVLCKPSIKNIINLYYESLQYLTINTSTHDIKFIEDNWESPILGASGTGWEVWLNNSEISQFTYFQKMGGIECYPTVVEIAYGLERIAMNIQNKNSFYDIIWGKDKYKTYFYKDIFKPYEVESSYYNFDYNNSDSLINKLYEYEKDFLILIKKNMPILSYDLVIKSSHIFNILNSRNTLSSIKKKKMFLKIRNMCYISAMKYLEKY